MVRTTNIKPRPVPRGKDRAKGKDHTGGTAPGSHNGDSVNFPSSNAVYPPGQQGLAPHRLDRGGVHELEPVSGVMRTATTDEPARRWFRRYWTSGVGSGAHSLVNGLLDVTREMAEPRGGVADS